MEFHSIRVGIEYKGVRKATIFPKNADYKSILIKSLELFSLPTEEWNDYILIIQLLDCQAENAEILQNNEWLILKKIENDHFHMIKKEKTQIQESDEDGSPAYRKFFEANVKSFQSQKTADFQSHAQESDESLPMEDQFENTKVSQINYTKSKKYVQELNYEELKMEEANESFYENDVFEEEESSERICESIETESEGEEDYKTGNTLKGEGNKNTQFNEIQVDTLFRRSMLIEKIFVRK